ncbi:hypothetical protein L7F22_017257, partial [Adiantum nelumboides]|nr:hypothetical protein [Adiantum nelumboides]
LSGKDGLGGCVVGGVGLLSLSSLHLHVILFTLASQKGFCPHSSHIVAGDVVAFSPSLKILEKGFTSRSRIIFETAGVFLEELRCGGLKVLSRYKVIIFDEVHESCSFSLRNLNFMLKAGGVVKFGGCRHDSCKSGLLLG